MRQNHKSIPQTDPKASYLAHQFEIDEAIRRVLDSGKYIMGQEVSTFELEFATYLGMKQAIGVGNGTDALEIALRACGVGPGDLVFTVSHTAVATVAAIDLVGATPVLVDIDPVTYTMDPNSLECALAHSVAGKAKAVIPVHLYGQPADMPGILEVSRHHGLHVIEDCAQSHGAVMAGSKTGTWGDIATFSFYPTKNLGAIGDGGVIATNSSLLAERMRLLRQYGWRERYISDIPGGNTRLDELQAAILRVKLNYLDEENECRRYAANKYDSLLADSGIVLPKARANTSHVFHQYVILSERRDELMVFLRQKGVGTAIHYPQPIHLQKAYRERLQATSLDHTEKVVRQVLSLPMFPQLDYDSIKYVTECIKLFQS